MTALQEERFADPTSLIGGSCLLTLLNHGVNKGTQECNCLFSVQTLKKRQFSSHGAVKVALFNLIYQRYHKANEADSYTNVSPHHNLCFPHGEKVLLESDRKASWVEEGTFFFSTQNVSANLHRLFPLGPNYSRMGGLEFVSVPFLVP